MRPRRPAPPLWFLLALALVEALALRAWFGAHGVAPSTPLETGRPAVAFFAFLIGLAELLWKGLQVAGQATLAAIKWVVDNHSLILTKLKNGLSSFGKDLLKGFTRAWDFTKKLYDDVLKPAWQKFWAWFDRFRSWLDRTFGPVLEWLKTVRKTLLEWWQTYVRPWLDLIDVSRKLLRVFAALGLDWASALDKRLGELESQIEKPFRYVLSKLNEVIDVVNRIITVNGLLQRLVLVRSLERDYVYAWRAAVNPWHRLISDDERKKGDEGKDPSTLTDVVKWTATYINGDTNEDTALLYEMRQQWIIYLRGNRGAAPSPDAALSATPSPWLG